MPRLTFIRPGGARLELEVPSGRSVMEVGREQGLIEGTCDGSLACATCHVIVDPADLARLAVALPEEEDMLDFAIGLTPTSRLGCQIVLCEALDGLTVRLPERV
jgi:ferredoxin, 2Fe-2S